MPRYCTVLVWWRDIHIYSLFKEGKFVAMDVYRYSIKKQMDGLNLGKMRHSFHSFVNSIIYFRLAAFGGISFLMFKEGGLRVTRMLVTNSPRWRILNVWREALYSDGWGTTALQTKI